jgi:hypothetical protein
MDFSGGGGDLNRTTTPLLLLRGTGGIFKGNPAARELSRPGEWQGAIFQVKLSKLC